jgi:hypothetical protein
VFSISNKKWAIIRSSDGRHNIIETSTIEPSIDRREQLSQETERTTPAERYTDAQPNRRDDSRDDPG